HVSRADRAWRELENHRNHAPRRARGEAASPPGPAWLLHGNLSPERAGGRRHQGAVRARQSFAFVTGSVARLALPAAESAGQALSRGAGRGARHRGGCSRRVAALWPMGQRVALRRKSVAALHSPGLCAWIRGPLRDRGLPLQMQRLLRCQRRPGSTLERSGNRHLLADAFASPVGKGQELPSTFADCARPVTALPAMSLRVLITGATGQIGWHLQRTLAPLGDVTALTRDQLDLSDLDAVTRAVREFEPDVLVNAAAYTAVDKAESEPELARTINALAPARMAEELARNGCLLIHYSSDYVFDGN